MEKDFAAHYDQVASQYSQLRIDGEDEIIDLQKYILSFASKTKPSLLDIGCGVGRYSQALEKQNFDVYGIDLSSANITQSNHKNYIYGNFLTHTFSQPNFDFLIAVYVIQQISDPNLISFFQKCANLLPSDGKLILKTALDDDIENRVVSSIYPSSISINKARYPSYEKLLECAALSGLELKECAKKIFPKTMLKSDLINRFRTRYNTTLHYLSDAEIETGITTLLESDDSEISFHNSCHYVTFCK